MASRVPRVHALPEYYRASRIADHAGLDDTSLTKALAPSMVRQEAVRERLPSVRGDGAVGDPRRASAEQGRPIAERIVMQSVTAIRRVVGRQSQP